MTMSVEKRVGIFFLLTLIVLAVMIEMVEEWDPLEQKIAYSTRFNSVVGMNMGDPVRVAGVQVGKITAIGLTDNKVQVDFYVNSPELIRKGTVAAVRRTNLLGGVFLGLEFGKADGEVLPEGAMVNSVEMADIDQVIANIDRNQERVFGGLGSLIEESRGKLSKTVGHLESITRKIDEGEGLLGQAVNDKQLYVDMQLAVRGLSEIAAKLNRGEGSLGRLVNEDQLYVDLHQTVANLRDLTGQMQQGEGTIGRLLVDDSLYEEGVVALSQIREIAEKMNRGQGSLGLLVNDDSLYFEARDMMARVNSIAGKIDDGTGTLGRLVNDDDIYREAKTTLRKVEKAADGLSDSGPISAVGTVIGTLF